MPIHAWWKRIVTTWKSLRPARRRRSLRGYSAEAFEPRRLLSAFFVNSLADSHDANVGDGIAADANGRATLRAALEESNANAGADTITLPAGVIMISAANGSLPVTNDVTLIGSETTVIDGTAFDAVFSVTGAGQLKLDNVAVRSSRDLPISRPPLLLTTNVRQSDLIVAFSAITAPPLAVETKTSNGLSPLVGIPAPESELDEIPIEPRPKPTKPASIDDSAVPTPEQAIDEIINALFRTEPDFVVPVGTEQTPGPMKDNNARPMSKAAPEDPTSDDMPSPQDSDDEEVSAILRGWEDEAGWNEFDFLTRGSNTVATLPQRGSRVATMAGMLLGSVAATAWSQENRGSWRKSLSLSAWRTRLERLRRRAR